MCVEQCLDDSGAKAMKMPTFRPTCVMKVKFKFFIPSYLLWLDFLGSYQRHTMSQIKLDTPRVDTTLENLTEKVVKRKLCKKL